jgi:hypothetical protein
MSGQPVRNFTDFWNSTGPFIASGPDEIINNAARRKYTLRHFLKGKKFSDIAQGGQRIEDELLLTDKATAENYKPGATGTPQQPQVLTKVYENWRFTRDHKAWQDEVLRLQTNGRTREARFQVYKKLGTSLEQSMWTSILNKLEDNLWALPAGQQAEMETETGGDPKSIPAILSEDTTLYAPSTSAANNTTAWTTIHGVSPATETNWRNPVTRYNAADLIDADNDLDGLFDAFERMWMLLRWESPGKADEHFEDVDPGMCGIFCSFVGKMQYQSVCRLSNDRFVGNNNNDPSYDGVNFHGVKLTEIEQLNTAAIYWDGAAYSAEDASALAAPGTAWLTSDWTRGPRYWWINSTYMRMWFNDEMFFDRTPPKDHVNQPWSNVVWMRVCYNLLARSRKMGGGVISPGGTANAA